MQGGKKTKLRSSHATRFLSNLSVPASTRTGVFHISVSSHRVLVCSVNDMIKVGNKVVVGMDLSPSIMRAKIGSMASSVKESAFHSPTEHRRQSEEQEKDQSKTRCWLTYGQTGVLPSLGLKYSAMSNVA